MPKGRDGDTSILEASSLPQPQKSIISATAPIPSPSTSSSLLEISTFQCIKCKQSERTLILIPCRHPLCERCFETHSSLFTRSSFQSPAHPYPTCPSCYESIVDTVPMSSVSTTTPTPSAHSPQPTLLELQIDLNSEKEGFEPVLRQLKLQMSELRESMDDAHLKWQQTQMEMDQKQSELKMMDIKETQIEKHIQNLKTHLIELNQKLDAAYLSQTAAQSEKRQQESALLQLNQQAQSQQEHLKQESIKLKKLEALIQGFKVSERSLFKDTD